MSSQPDPQSKRLPKIVSSPSLKFWVVTPIVILTTFFILALIGTRLISGSLPLGLLLISIASFLAVAGLALLITRQIARRLDHIVEASEQVAHGDFTIRINDERNDEIGRLVRAFNKMVIDLEHLQQSRDLLSRTMSPPVRKSLIEKGLDFRGIPQTVSILFIDIRDFTRLTEAYQTEQFVFFLNDYYSTIANQVHIGGGIIGKYGGDSILAYFGAPEPQPPSKSAMDALLTSLALQEAIEELSEYWRVLGLPAIQVGMGLSIGTVVAGPIGTAEQFEYTVIGDAVNLAARLQELTRNVTGYGIMISAEVYEALDERIRDQIQVVSMAEYEAMDTQEKVERTVHCVDLGEVIVKGKKGLVHVLGVPDYPPNTRGKDALSERSLGRSTVAKSA
jgi:class 3 adenylate cyclase